MPSSLPSAVERRELLFGRESIKADHGAMAARYEEQGRLTDALDFYAKAEDPAGIASISRAAVKDGDAFLLAQVVRVTGEPVDPATWRETAENAERGGKARFAAIAYREAGDEANAERLTEALADAPPTDGAAPVEGEASGDAAS